MRLSRLILTSSAICLSLAVTSLAVTSFVIEPAFAQAKPAAPAADAGDQIEQVALSEKQIQNLLAAQKDVSAITAKIPQNDDGPSPKVLAQLDAVAKKNGFSDYAEYDKVSSNVSLVLAGFDPDTKTFIGPDAVIKKQITEVNSDKEMSAKDKKEALAQLNEAAKSAVPVKFPENIKLAGKYYDKLSEIFQQD